MYMYVVRAGSVTPFLPIVGPSGQRTFRARLGFDAAAVQTTVNTTAAAAAAVDNDAWSQCDVIATYPEHLLLNSIGQW